MLPNWIIAGAPKSGTTSLFQWLVDHPEVDGSKEKETYYFSDFDSHMYSFQESFDHKGLDGYAELFAHCNPASRVILESTPGYMYSRTAIDNIPYIDSRPNLIFILREPVDQIKSLFNYFQNNWAWIPPTMTFRDFIADVKLGAKCSNGNELVAHALENANYVNHLKLWRDACGAGRVHVFLFEEMISQKREFMLALARTMNIDASFYENYHFPSENVSYAVRSRILQSINLKFRARLPKGHAYETLRRLYRALNTTPAPGSRVLDLETERDLSHRYSSLPLELAYEFGVDTTSWQRLSDARFRSQPT